MFAFIVYACNKKLTFLYGPGFVHGAFETGRTVLSKISLYVGAFVFVFYKQPHSKTIKYIAKGVHILLTM